MTSNNSYLISKRIIRIIFLLFMVLPGVLFSQTKSANGPGYGKASYNTTTAGKYMRSWLLAGPVNVDAVTAEPNDALQEKIFKEDQVSLVSIAPVSSLRIKDRNIDWKLFSSEGDIVDLDAYYKSKDFAYAYALAEIKSATTNNVILGLGSDDGVKVWLNGKLVHDNWIPRAVNKDDDLVPLKLVKGSNQLLIKVQDMTGWLGFYGQDTR